MSQRAATLMIQGTSSSVGKSLIVAGLCRLFARAGYRVAPFKAQNMALNSYVTADGGEMGRAQVVQAEAACTPPTVDMNPILLKPEAAARSQLIVHGRVRGALASGDFLRRKADLWPYVTESLDRLRADFDLVMIEGAGSPAEINLKAGDIVNMRVARYADAPVLLAGDIDRGGVFAALVGTLALLEPAELRHVRGLLINKFRGDPALLAPGLAMLETRTDLPVLGVIPYLPDPGIADEDSVALDERREARPSGILDLAVIRLPYTQNFDDFDPLEREPGVSVRYVRSLPELGRPHLVILPGSKTTMHDLMWLRDSGLAARIVELATAGTAVLGVCGGYQMLGSWITDPERIESKREQEPGLGLLPVRTEFRPEKRTRQVTGRVVSCEGLLRGLAGMTIEGYEIHLGESSVAESPALRVRDAGDSGEERSDGAVAQQGRVVGTYLHGLFGNQEFRHGFLSNVAALHGLAWQPGDRPTADPYDRLADLMEEALGLRRLEALLESWTTAAPGGPRAGLT